MLAKAGAIEHGLCCGYIYGSGVDIQIVIIDNTQFDLILQVHYLYYGMGELLQNTSICIFEPHLTISVQ